MIRLIIYIYIYIYIMKHLTLSIGFRTPKNKNRTIELFLNLIIPQTKFEEKTIGKKSGFSSVFVWFVIKYQDIITQKAEQTVKKHFLFKIIEKKRQKKIIFKYHNWNRYGTAFWFLYSSGVREGGRGQIIIK